MQRLKKTIEDTRILMSCIPAWVFTLFVTSTMVMNLLANKSISLPFPWLALDCGIFVSWVSFFSMDIITKHFGAKASITVSIVAILVNVLFILIYALASSINGVWGEANDPAFAEQINGALDRTFKGTWYVILGSFTAYIVSAVVNSEINSYIGKITKMQGVKEYALRSCVSTMAGQFVDNLTFALIVSYNFFGWTLVQCITCSLTGAIVELIFEAIFTSTGYKIVKRWEENGVGREYLKIRESISNR